MLALALAMWVLIGGASLGLLLLLFGVGLVLSAGRAERASEAERTRDNGRLP